MSRATKPHVESQGTKAPQSTAPPALMWPYQGQEIEESGGKNTQRPPQHANPSKDWLTMATAEERVRASQKVGHLRKTLSTTSSSSSTPTPLSPSLLSFFYRHCHHFFFIATVIISLFRMIVNAIPVIIIGSPFALLVTKHRCIMCFSRPLTQPARSHHVWIPCAVERMQNK